MIILIQIDNRTSEEDNFLFSGKKRNAKTLRVCKGIERTSMHRKSDEGKELR